MKTTKNLFIFLLVLLFPVCLKAQNISKVRLEEYRKLTEDRVADFQNYLYIITNKSLPMEERREAIEQARSMLCIEGAKIQITGRNNTTKRVLMGAYLNSLLSLNQYDKVEVTNYGILLISNLKKDVNGNYYATATYFSKFEGFDKNGKAIYVDKICRNIFVTSIVGNQAMKSDDMKIFLGDVTICETTPLTND